MTPSSLYPDGGCVVLLGSATSSGSRQMVVSLSFTMNEETATVDFLCPTVDRATGTLRRLIHRVVLLCAAASYLLSLPLQVMFLGFLSLGETPKGKGVPLFSVVLLLSAQTLVMVAKNLRE